MIRNCRTGWGNPCRGGGGRLYRARDGKFMGVCKGLAEHFCVSVKALRALVIIAAVFSGFWPVLGLYVLLGLVLSPRPMLPCTGVDERSFYDTCVASRAEAVAHLRERVTRLDARIRKMEDVVTRRDFDWERRFRQGR